jgi:hypothetical protein
MMVLPSAWLALPTAATTHTQSASPNPLKNLGFDWPAQTNGDVCASGWQKDNAITPHEWTAYWTYKSGKEVFQNQISGSDSRNEHRRCDRGRHCGLSSDSQYMYVDDALLIVVDGAPMAAQPASSPSQSLAATAAESAPAVMVKTPKANIQAAPSFEGAIITQL